jgi:hypothetical protein
MFAKKEKRPKRIKEQSVHVIVCRRLEHGGKSALLGGGKSLTLLPSSPENELRERFRQSFSEIAS